MVQGQGSVLFFGRDAVGVVTKLENSPTGTVSEIVGVGRVLVLGDDAPERSMVAIHLALPRSFPGAGGSRGGLGDGSPAKVPLVAGA